MNKRLLSIGLVLTVVLAIGVGLAFRSVVSAVAGSERGRTALAHLERALNEGEVDGVPSTAGAPADAAGPSGDIVAVAPDGVSAAGDVLFATADVAGGRIEEGPGVLVTGVVADGPAAKAGIVRGDIVLAVDGTDVKRLVDLHKALKDKAAGATVRLKVQHGDDVREREVTLTGKGMARLGIVSCGGGMPGRIAVRRVIGGGPAVIEAVTADSPAAKAGLKEGDRITAVDDVPLTGGVVAFSRDTAGGQHGGLHGFFGRLFGDPEGAAVEPDDDPTAAEPGEGDAASGNASPSVPAEPGVPVVPAVPAVPMVEAKASGRTLADAIARHKPGDSVKLTVERDGEAKRDVTVVLAAHPDDATKAFLGVSYGAGLTFPAMDVTALPDGAIPDGALPALPAMPMFDGAMGEDPAMRDFFGQLGDDASGIVVGEVVADGAAAKAGLKAHDVIAKIDGQAVEGPRELAEAVAGHKPGDTVTLTVLRPNADPQDIRVTLGAHPDDASKGYLGLAMTGFFMHRVAPDAGSDTDTDAGSDTGSHGGAIVAPGAPIEIRIAEPPSSDA